MKTMQLAKIKAHLSAVVKEVKNGEDIVVSYGKKNEPVAVIIPYEQYLKSKKRKLGTLKNKAKVQFSDDFQISDEELFN